MGPYGYFEDLQYQNLGQSVLDSNNRDKAYINSIGGGGGQNSIDYSNGLSAYDRSKNDAFDMSLTGYDSKQSTQPSLTKTAGNAKGFMGMFGGGKGKGKGGGKAGGAMGGGGKGAGAMNAVGSGVAAVGEGVAMFNRDDSELNEGGHLMKNLNMGMKGAEFGMQVGGPWGAAIGGVVGTVAGIVDSAIDIKKGAERFRKNYQNKLRTESTQRERDYLREKNTNAIQKLKALREDQMNYVSEGSFNQNYYQG